jgi:ketosteroid isomerase-like protein
VATFQNVRINQLGPEATRWLHEVLTALDAKDVDAYTVFMADDVEASFNNGEMTMRGREAVRDGLARFWQSFGTLAHDELNIYGTDRNLVHEALNYYTTLDGREVTIRAVAWVDRDDDGNIVSLRIYNDQSPLWDQSAASR